MGHWPTILCLLAATAGAIVFLGVVADELRLLEQSLKLRVQIERERRVRQQAHEDANIDVIEVGP